MPSASSISINDATPTAHVFVPISVTPQLSLFRNTADASISASEEQVGLSISRASAQRDTNKVKVTLSVPHEQTIDGAVVVRSTARGICEFILPDDMTSTERADFAKLMANALDHADIAGYLTDLAPVY